MAGDGTGNEGVYTGKTVKCSDIFHRIISYDMLKALLHADRWWKADADSGKGETDMY